MKIFRVLLVILFFICPMLARAEEMIKINELCFYPPTNQSQWVELVNVSQEPIKLSLVSFKSAQGIRHLPDGLGELAPGGIKVIYFDDKNGMTKNFLGNPDGYLGVYLDPDNEAYQKKQQAYQEWYADHNRKALEDFNANPKSSLHIDPQKLIESIKSSPNPPVLESTHIVDFVAWGNYPPDDAVQDAAGSGLWNPRTCIWTDPNNMVIGPKSDDYIDKPGMTIGRPPDSYYGAWIVFRVEDASPGLPNPLPIYEPKIMMPNDGMESSGCPVFWWASDLPKVQIQFSETLDFNQITAALESSQNQLHQCPKELKANQKYYWRLRSVASDGRASQWGKPAEFSFN